MKMSDVETLKSDADRKSLPPEATDSNQVNKGDVSSVDTGNAVPPTKTQDTAAQDAEPKVNSTENGSPTLKETNASEIANGNAPKNAVTATECAKETVENSVSKISVNEPMEQPSNASEIQQQTSIGAGDTCFIGKRDENANVQEPNKEITDQTPMSEDRSLVNNDKKVNDDELTISKLKQEVQKAIEERDSYLKKLESTEKKLASLQVCYDALMKGEGDEVMLRRMVDQLKGKLIQASLQLEDRMRTVSNQEKQISALNNQVASLKEVESLTRSLLQIRNMEVKHLQTEIDNMEVRINEERERYNTTINKMDAAVKLNADLKKEYETQLCLFRDLREKYEEKVTLLTKEKEALENNTQTPPK